MPTRPIEDEYSMMSISHMETDPCPMKVHGLDVDCGQDQSCDFNRCRHVYSPIDAQGEANHNLRRLGVPFL
jgi:hypothetical protein